MKMIFWILLVVVIGLMAYIRLAPSDAATWHILPQIDGDSDHAGGAKRVVQTGPDGLSRLHEVANSTPRTKVLAGSVDDGMVTYVTRTRVMGFPDYTTAHQDGDDLKLHGRLRFGRSDFGVNRARIEAWIKALTPGG